MKHKFYWLNPKLTVGKTARYGVGTFANKNIKKGELLLILSGYVMKVVDEEKLPKGLSDNGIQVTEDFCLSVARKEDLGGINFFNHSCDPNVGIKGQIFLVAMKNIRSGEEATFDYAMTLCRTKNATPYRLRCLCEKKICRGIVTDDDWRKKEIQEKYQGFFQYYIQEKINALRIKK
ncbi:MAG: SET domain-containing protein-lysine N-methyltransferase [Candidatus Moraniibacteriota bacterium]